MMNGFQLALGAWVCVVASTAAGATTLSARPPATSAVLVKDIRPGSGSALPTALVAMGGQLYFLAVDGEGAHGLWRSDGTEEGTVRLKSFQRYQADSFDSPELVVVGETLFLVADDGSTGMDLWKSDGTEAGTVLVKDFPTGGEPRTLTPMGRTLYFTALSGLWKSDGTPAGTVPVRTGLLPLGPLTVMGSRLYFQASSTEGNELWRSDGTEAGTVLLKDIYPGSGSGSPRELTNVNGTLFFVANNGSTGDELWKSDGTASGTVLVKDIRPGSGSSSPYHLTNVNGTLFFSAGTEDYSPDNELWKSDGTASGTVRVKDIALGNASSFPEQLTALDGTLYFFANDNLRFGKELWKSDGTEAGTVLLKDINPGLRDSLADSMTAVNGALFFSATEDVHGLELWKSNGTTGGTRLVAAVAPEGTLAKPDSFTAVGDMLFFVTNDGVHGRELWRLPLTPAGDTAPPELTCPPAQLVEATSPHGTYVPYPPATAADDVTDALTVGYDGSSAFSFPLGTTTVTATTRDEAGHTASCTFDVTVRDTTPPTLTCPAEVSGKATDASGGTVSYASASARDSVSEERVTLAYSHPSGTHFALGRTDVTVQATDEAGNTSACTFAVTVSDTTPPTLVCGEDVVAEATSASGAAVEFPLPPASDDVTATPSVTSEPSSGGTFSLGSTPITVTARDDAGNSATCHFAVTVRDTTPPDLGCPGALVAEAEDASGASVAFSSPRPRDAVTASPSVSLTHAPGSRFSLGTTPVTFTARDEAGNTASCAFDVTVRDTTPPALTCPADMTVDAPDSRGALVSYPSATASDTVTSTVEVRASPASGSRFPPGDNPVRVTATDAAGNVSRCTFHVSVRKVPIDVSIVPVTGCGCGTTSNRGASFGAGALLLLAWGTTLRRRRSPDAATARASAGW